MAKKVIIDTDPGVDDAMAILFALACPEIEVVGLTSIFGNVTTKQATQNALRLVEFADRPDIPVAHGANAPLAMDLDVIAYYVHGDDGLGNTNQPPPIGSAVDVSAAQFIVDTVMANPGEITLLPIGPLTNIALALAMEPKIVEYVAEVIIMGGAATVNGNVNPAAEANIWHDPHAADKVLTAGLPLIMVGLDVTTQVLMDEDYFDRLHATGSKTCAYIYGISRFYCAFYQSYTGINGCFTHDPSVVAYLLDPTLFRTIQGPVRVLTDGIAMGQTILDPSGNADFKTAWSSKPSIHVCVGVDEQGVLDLYFQRMYTTS